MFNAAIKLEDLEQENNELKLKDYNNIEMPTKTIEQLNKDVGMLDGSTVKWIIKYLTLDSYEFVKNNAKTLNTETGHETIIYRDGALSRNDGLIKALSRKNTKDKSFNDRITGEVKQVEKANKKL